MMWSRGGGLNIKRERNGGLATDEKLQPNQCQNKENPLSLQPLSRFLRSRGRSCSPFECAESERETIGTRGKLIECERKRKWGVLGEEEEDLEFVQDGASCGIAASSE